jgi:hypothetical protein
MRHDAAEILTMGKVAVVMPAAAFHRAEIAVIGKSGSGLEQWHNGELPSGVTSRHRSLFVRLLLETIVFD